jgi:hypothetical protein
VYPKWFRHNFLKEETTMAWIRTGSFSVAALAVLTVIGCGGNATKSASPATPVAINWCVEHGVPEDICAQCNAKVAAEYKQKGDWCKEHNRPESQCFLCNPKLQAKFTAEYEAKNGSKPPKPDGA